MARGKLAENPFYVLGLRPDASRPDVERAAQKLIAMVEVGLAEAGSYATPVGGMPRDADVVRAAAAELRDPERRLIWELWAALAPDEDVLLDDEAPERPDGWKDAATAFGWKD